MGVGGKVHGGGRGLPSWWVWVCWDRALMGLHSTYHTTPHGVTGNPKVGKIWCWNALLAIRLNLWCILD
ncbi:hypothetical protein CFP56_019095 [Quercus suber]|uniref:Uncharacterized protein n=1 Tax=Quercus suber TaxID=58331 RepID=A0AAW0KI45_QUESU